MIDLKALDSFSLTFLDYVLFRPWIDDQNSDFIVCSQQIIHDIHGSSRKVHQKKNKTKELLEYLQLNLKDILPFEIMEYSSIAGKAYSINPIISDELKLKAEDRKVRFKRREIKYLSLIDKKSPSLKQLKKAEIEYLNQKSYFLKNTPLDHPLYEELKWLNGRKPHAFARLKANISAAKSIAAELIPIEKAIVNLDNLSNLPHMQVIYKTSDSSPRLYAIRGGIQTLSKPVRHALFGPSAIHLDLEAAQLAIVAKIWDIPSIQTLLKQIAQNRDQGSPIWTAMLEPIQAEFPQIGKAELKSLIYPMAFGMSKKELSRRIESSCGVTLKQLQNSSCLIADLLTARDQRKISIREDGVLTDVFGKEHKYIEANYRNEYTTNVRALMAYEAQAYEVALMKPAIQYCMSQPRCSLDLLIHDGITIRPTEADKSDMFVRGIQRAVQLKADELCIITRLVRE